MIAPLILLGLVPVSRMYLGAHSANQVMQGLLNGLGFLVLYRYVIRELLSQYLSSFLKRTHTLAIISGTIITHILCIIVPMITYKIKVSYSISLDDVSNIVHNCKTPESSIKSLNSSLLLMASLANLMFGFVYGLYSVREYYGYYFGNWRYKNTGSVWVRIVKIGIDIGLIGGPIAVFGFCGLFVFSRYEIQYIFVCLGFLIGGYLYIGQSARILSKLKIIQIINSK
jgi:hypothetical protein